MRCSCKDILNRLALVGLIGFSAFFVTSTVLILVGDVGVQLPIYAFIGLLVTAFLRALAEEYKLRTPERFSKLGKQESFLGLRIGLRKTNSIHPENIRLLDEVEPDLYDLLTKEVSETKRIHPDLHP